MYHDPAQDKPFSTKHVITTLGHTLSVAVFYIHTNIFQHVLQSDSTGLGNWFMYTDTRVTNSKTVRFPTQEKTKRRHDTLPRYSYYA